MVHDDIFAYSFYRGGQLLDQYNSCPDYFDDDFGEEEAGPSGGHPEVFRDLLGDEGLEGLRELLAADQPVFAGESLARFAELLGLPNACSSYEYLVQGETDDVEGWDEFVHVPDQGEEKARQRAAQADLDAAKERQRADGLLLLEQSGPGPMSMPAWCPDREGGFLVCWANLMGKGQSPVVSCASPWSTPLPGTGILADAQARVLELSPSGRYLAAGDGLGKVLLWDLERHAQCWKSPTAGRSPGSASVRTKDISSACPRRMVPSPRSTAASG
jgi:hypothetical protein